MSKKPPTELYCYQPRKPVSNCDEQLELNLRNSIEQFSNCRVCGAATYTKYERRRSMCVGCIEDEIREATT